MSSRPFVLRRGLNELTQFLRQEQARFAASPILFVSSSSNRDQNQGTVADGVETVSRHVQFRLQQQLGFRTVPTTTISSHLFPTTEAIDETLQLAERVGATTVVAVGSPHSLHLAKALSSHAMFQELILIPATIDACMVAAVSHALVWDTEHVIVPSSRAASRAPTLVALPDDALFAVAATSRNESLWAIMALALDRLLQIESTEWTTTPAWAHLTRALDLSVHTDAAAAAAAEFLVEAGHDLVQFGLVDHSLVLRSSPLAVATSLVASESTLAQYSATTLMASLVPALVELARAQLSLNSDADVSSILQQLSTLRTPTIVTNESTATLLSYIQDNQAHWNCRDVSDDLFRAMLRHHSLVG